MLYYFMKIILKVPKFKVAHKFLFNGSAKNIKDT